jgi:hypothetical protein
MSNQEIVPKPVASGAAAMARRPAPRATVPALARDAIDDLVGLFSSQLDLTRAELRADARAYARSALALVILVPLLVVGYCLLVAALVVVLSGPLGTVPVLVGLGGLHVAGAGLGLWRASRRMSAVRFLDRAGAELGKSVERVSEALNGAEASSVSNEGPLRAR